MLEEKPHPKTFWFREILLAKQNQTRDFLSVALEPDLLNKLSSDKLDKGITPNFRFCDKQKVLAKCFKICYILTPEIAFPYFSCNWKKQGLGIFLSSLMDIFIEQKP